MPSVVLAPTVTSSRAPRPARTASSAIVSAVYGVSQPVRSRVPLDSPVAGTMRTQKRAGPSAPRASASQRARMRRLVAAMRSPYVRTSSRMRSGTTIANSPSSAIDSSTRSRESAARSSRRETSATSSSTPTPRCSTTRRRTCGSTNSCIPHVPKPAGTRGRDGRGHAGHRITGPPSPRCPSRLLLSLTAGRTVAWNPGIPPPLAATRAPAPRG